VDGDTVSAERDRFFHGADEHLVVRVRVERGAAREVHEQPDVPAVPPVAKIMDYGKFKYEQAKKEREMRKTQHTSIVREIRLRPKIGDHDFEAKTRSVKKLLADGDKVKITIMFRGREITHAQLGWKLLEKMMEALKGTVTIEKQPQMEGSRMFMILSPLVVQQQGKQAAPAAKPSFNRQATC